MRWAFWFILITAVALLISVMVAWSCALWSPAHPKRFGINRIDATHPLVQPFIGRGEFDTYVYVGPGSGWGWRTETVLASDSRYASSAPVNQTRFRYYWCGWPFKCLVGQTGVIRGEEITIGLVRRPDLPGVGTQGLRKLPTRPVWSGLIANVALFGLPGYLLVGFFWGRRIARQRRGCCLRCGYSLRGLRGDTIICPECGAAAPSHSGAAAGAAG